MVESLIIFCFQDGGITLIWYGTFMLNYVVSYLSGWSLGYFQSWSQPLIFYSSCM